MAEGGKVISDVGTDHGLLPIYFAQNFQAAKIFAADLRQGPINVAKENAKAQGVYSRINFFCCDGLDFPDASLSDTVIISGMGGETIAGILQRAKWTVNCERLILGPQTKYDELCIWLFKNGYMLKDANVICEDGRLYLLLLIGALDSKEPKLLFAEDYIIKKESLACENWIKDRIKRTNKAIFGANKAKDNERSAKLTELLDRLSKY